MRSAVASISPMSPQPEMTPPRPSWNWKLDCSKSKNLRAIASSTKKLAQPAPTVTTSRWEGKGVAHQPVSGGELLVAGQCGGEGEECGEQPGAAFVALGQSAVAGGPGDRAFDDPAVPAQPGAGLTPRRLRR